MLVLGLSGFAALAHEIVWTRILSLVLGPTTYAFAAALAAVIAGVAIGSGAHLDRRPHLAAGPAPAVPWAVPIRRRASATPT